MKIIRIIMGVVVFHIAVIGLFCSMPMFGSKPEKQIVITAHALMQMNYLNVSPKDVKSIMNTGIKMRSYISHRVVYICHNTKIGVTYDNSSHKITDVVLRENLYKFLK